MIEGYYNKLQGRLYGLLCEREKGGAWEKFLETILLELYGLEKIDKTINYFKKVINCDCIFHVHHTSKLLIYLIQTQ